MNSYQTVLQLYAFGVLNKLALGIYSRGCEHGNGDPCDGLGSICEVCQTDGCNRDAPEGGTQGGWEELNSNEGNKIFDPIGIGGKHCNSKFLLQVFGIS